MSSLYSFDNFDDDGNPLDELIVNMDHVLYVEADPGRTGHGGHSPTAKFTFIGGTELSINTTTDAYELLIELIGPE